MFSDCSLEPNTPINFMSGCTLAFSPLCIFFVPVFRLHIFYASPGCGAEENAEHKIFSARFSAALHCFPKTRGQKHNLFLHGRTCAAQIHPAHMQHSQKRKKPGYLMRLAAPSSSTKCSFGSRNSIRMGQSDLAETQKKTPREFPGRRGAWKIASALCDFFRERRSHLRFLSSQILTH